jgi:hypothetical protein
MWMTAGIEPSTQEDSHNDMCISRGITNSTNKACHSHALLEHCVQYMQYTSNALVR